MPEDRALLRAGAVGSYSPAVVVPYSERRSLGDGEKSVSLDRLRQPGNCAEDLEGSENQPIRSTAIQCRCMALSKDNILLPLLSFKRTVICFPLLMTTQVQQEVMISSF
jgi:hypothetical protein